MDYLKKNHLSLLIIIYLVVAPFLGGSGALGALDRTTVGNPWTFSGAVTMSSTLSAAASSFSGLLTTNAGTLRSYTLATTTTATAVTLKVSDVANYDTISVLQGGQSTLTYTFFASSTASTWLPTAGDMQETCFLNATTTGGATLIFAAGTGIDLQVASSTTMGQETSKDLTIAPNSTGCFKFIRKAATATAFDIEANLVEYGDAD